MQNSFVMKEIELFCVVANYGKGSKVVKIAKENGVTGGTIFLGNGTVKSSLLQMLGLYEERKEIVLMIAETEVAHKALEELDRKLEFKKPHHGIAFTTSVRNFVGGKKCIHNNVRGSRGAGKHMYNAVFVVVERGNAEGVVDTATAAGARGATVINARGSGSHETSTLFSMAIEPEKEIVLILIPTDITDTVVSAIQEQHHIDEPGKGVMFILDVNRTYGLA